VSHSKAAPDYAREVREVLGRCVSGWSGDMVELPLMSSPAVRRNTLVRAVYTTPNTDRPGDRAFTRAYDRATNGAKSRPNNSSDLLSPHILRSICNVQVTKALTGPSANYAVVFDRAVPDSIVHVTAYPQSTAPFAYLVGPRRSPSE
jgi:hypothetical protein